jgi:hypothetical protein
MSAEKKGRIVLFDVVRRRVAMQYNGHVAQETLPPDRITGSHHWID